MEDNKSTDFDERIQFREWDTYNLGEDTELDKYALDSEAQKQAHVYQKWSELLVQEQANLSNKKERLANKEAELTLQVRREGIPDISKPTEAVYKAWVQAQKSYQRMLEKKRKAENNIAYLQNALRALEHKRSMIKVEADLWIAGYYARPNVPSDLKSELDSNRRKQVHTTIEQTLKERQTAEKEK